MIKHQERTRGCILVAHGAKYRTLARRCAQYFRSYNPGIPIRLYSDIPIDDPLFDEVIVLEDVWVRSKIDAMVDSPFDQTLYIDVDALAVLDIRDGYDILDVHDIALAHDQGRNHPQAVVEDTRFLPNAFPMVNSGCIFFRRTPAVLGFLETWRERVRSTGARKDQPALRELAYNTNLRIAILPPEYNLGQISMVVANQAMTAPRVIHTARFHSDPKFLSCPYPILRFLGPRAYIKFLRAVRNDHYVLRAGAMPEYASFREEKSETQCLVTLKRITTLMELSARGSRVATRLLPTDLNLI